MMHIIKCFTLVSSSFSREKYCLGVLMVHVLLRRAEFIAIKKFSKVKIRVLNK